MSKEDPEFPDAFNAGLSALQRWYQMPVRTREYIKQELADCSIDIEELIAASERSGNNVCLPEEKFITIKRASIIAQCHPSTIRRRIKDGTLKIVKMHSSQQGGVRILVTSFLELLKAR